MSTSVHIPCLRSRGATSALCCDVAGETGLVAFLAVRRRGGSREDRAQKRRESYRPTGHFCPGDQRPPCELKRNFNQGREG